MAGKIERWAASGGICCVACAGEKQEKRCFKHLSLIKLFKIGNRVIETLSPMCKIDAKTTQLIPLLFIGLGYFALNSLHPSAPDLPPLAPPLPATYPSPKGKGGKGSLATPTPTPA